MTSQIGVAGPTFKAWRDVVRACLYLIASKKIYKMLVQVFQ